MLLYTETLDLLAARARNAETSAADLPSMSPVVHSGAALVVLTAAAALSIYKPRGLTRWGWRRQAL